MKLGKLQEPSCIQLGSDPCDLKTALELLASRRLSPRMFDKKPVFVN